MSLNRLANSKNWYQGTTKKVLCVCAGGLLRSPTAAWVLSNEPYNYNTRSAGLSEELSLIVVDDVLLHWADEIVVMEPVHEKGLKDRGVTKPIIVLNIPDDFPYRDKKLIELIKENYFKQMPVQPDEP